METVIARGRLFFQVVTELSMALVDPARRREGAVSRQTICPVMSGQQPV